MTEQVRVEPISPVPKTKRKVKETMTLLRYRSVPEVAEGNLLQQVGKGKTEGVSRRQRKPGRNTFDSTNEKRDVVNLSSKMTGEYHVLGKNISKQ